MYRLMVCFTYYTECKNVDIEILLAKCCVRAICNFYYCI